MSRLLPLLVFASVEPNDNEFGLGPYLLLVLSLGKILAIMRSEVDAPELAVDLEAVKLKARGSG